jgi:hypothetical protein
MDPLALSRKISSLEGSLHSLDFWLLTATLIVIGGVLFECIPEAIKIYKEWEKDPWPWLELIMLFGGAVVAIALAAELYVEARISDVQTELRKANDQAYASLNSEAQVLRLQIEQE